MKILTVFLVLILSFSVLFAQEKRSKKQIRTERKSQKIQLVKSFVDNKTFVFKAYSVIPKNERTKTLISDFGIEVRNDSIFSYLPYYGNTYSRDYSSFKDSPMGFAQPVESYKRVKTKKGFEVNIKVKNQNDLIDLAFHISKMGSATVVASSLNRQAITYTGEIFAPKPGE
jgi:hypothetical protein